MRAGLSKTVTWRTLSLSTLWGKFHAKVITRKFVQDVGILTIANFAGAGLNFVQGILVARWLGPELYGVAALVMAYSGLVYGVFDARSMTASVKYLGEYHARGEHERALAMCKLGYAVDLAVACLTFLVLVLTAHLAAQSIVHDPVVAGLMILYGAALIPRALVGTSSAIFATLGRFPFIAAIEFVITFLRVVLVTGLVLSGWQVAGVIWANALAATAAGLLYGAVAWVLIRRTWGGSIFQGKLKALKGGRRQIFAFLAYNDLGALVGIIPKQLDAILLGYFRGPTEVGYYKLAKSMSNVVDYLRSPLHSVTFPRWTRLWGLGHKQTLHQEVRNLAIWVGLPLGLTVLIVTGFVPFVLPLFVGENYLPAIRSAQLLFVGSAIYLSFFWLRPLYLAKNFVRELFVVSSSVTIIFGLVCPVFVWGWGYMGASTWMLARYVVGTGITGFWLWRQSKKHGDVIGRNNQTQMTQMDGAANEI
jgi:O-antigen/teichoic acid export membrane protein